MPRYSNTTTRHEQRRERQDTDPRTDEELFTAILRDAHLYDLTAYTTKEQDGHVCQWLEDN